MTSCHCATRPSALPWPEWRGPTIELGDWLKAACRRLAPVSDQPALEAQLLAAHSFNRSRAWIVAHSEAPLSIQQVELLDALLDRLLQGEPLAYIRVRAEFYGLEFIVTPSVLIPRPETELLVEAALAWLKAHPRQRRAADVGAGSGCIAVTLAKHVPGLFVIAADLSEAALQVARQNVARYGLREQVQLVQTNLLEGVGGALDLVCANLPYVPTELLPGLDVARYEPAAALDGGPEGLYWIDRLLAGLPASLAPGGLALLEIEAGQGSSAAALARRAFPQAAVSVLNDLAGRPRLLRVELPHG